MPTTPGGEDRPARPQPNESENQPGFEPGRKGEREGDDDGRRDERSSSPPAGVDPDQQRVGGGDERRGDQKRGTR
jgi:hypothetical protein